MERLLSRRRSQQGLPLTEKDPSVPDGSGRSVRMESPLLRSVRTASAFTKFSYAWLILSILSIILGWKVIRFSYATVDLICGSKQCTLKIIPPGRGLYTSLVFMRDQLLSSELTYIDLQGHERKPDPPEADAGARPQHRTHSSSPDKPDADGFYESFAVILAMQSPSNSSGSNDARSAKEWEQLIQRGFATQQSEGTYRVIIRRYNLGHAFKRVQTQMSQVYTYVKRQRQQIHIEEPRNVSWQGILLMVFGAMSFLISLALGQFWDSEDDVYGSSPKKIRKKMDVKRTTSTTSYRGIQNGLGSRPHSFAYTYTGYPNMKSY